MKTQGNTILITGATRGIGLALMKKFYSLNNEIIAVGRDQNSLIQLQKDFPKISVIQCDLSNSKSIKNLTSQIAEKHPSLNTLINNAGIQVNFYEEPFGTNQELWSDVEREIKVNLTSPIQLCFELIPILLKNKNASIVNVTSGLAFAPKKSAPVYCGTKSGIHIFSKALRYQYEDSGLKVFEIIPPLVDTDMTKGRGKGKITPGQLADEFLIAFKNNTFEVNIGKVKLLRILKRILPSVADNMLKNG